MGLIRFILWFALFLVSTFAFTVIFEHGFSNFSDNASKEWKSIQAMASDKADQKRAESSKVGR